MFKKIETAIAGCFELQPIVHVDPRGRFVKTYHADYFASNILETDFREQYYTISKKGVLRGMHFQNPQDSFPSEQNATMRHRFYSFFISIAEL